MDGSLVDDMGFVEKKCLEDLEKLWQAYMNEFGCWVYNNDKDEERSCSWGSLERVARMVGVEGVLQWF